MAGALAPLRAMPKVEEAEHCNAHAQAEYLMGVSLRPVCMPLHD